MGSLDIDSLFLVKDLKRLLVFALIQFLKIMKEQKVCQKFKIQENLRNLKEYCFIFSGKL